MAIEQNRNQDPEIKSDEIDKEFARFLASQTEASFAPKSSMSEGAPSDSIMDVTERDGIVTVKAGQGRDITFVYPEEHPLDVRVAGNGAKPEVVDLARGLFLAVTRIESWQPRREEDPKISHDFELARARIVSRLADAGRLDLVDVGRLISGLPGIDQSRPIRRYKL